MEVVSFGILTTKQFMYYKRKQKEKTIIKFASFSQNYEATETSLSYSRYRMYSAEYRETYYTNRRKLLVSVKYLYAR